MNGWILASSLLLLLWTRQGSAQVTPSPINPVPVLGQCYLQGYDLNTLSGRSYWTLSLFERSQWLVPVGVDPTDIASVEVSMAFCKPLPSELCEVNANSTFCQRIKMKNGTTYDFDMGTFSKDNEFIPNEKDTTGFLIKETGLIPVNTTTCKGKVSTIMEFQCDPLARWTTQNITKFAYLATHEIESCLYEINVLYNGSCYTAPTVAPGSCQLDNYDTSTLAKEPFWHATVPHTVCFNGTEDKTCTVIFSFCHALPHDQDINFDLTTCYEEGAAVCQIGVTSDGQKQLEYSMGQFEDYTRFYPNENEGGFHMAVINGSRPSNGSECPQGLNTRIVLFCNSNVSWPDDRDLTNLLHSYYDDKCQYVFEIQYKGACLTPDPINTQDSPSPIGWIFIGLFLFAVLVYVSVGMAFQYFVKGARGADIIPNYSFWALVGALVLEGCRFSLDIVTCFQLKKGSVKKSTHSGVQYDQI